MGLAQDCLVMGFGIDSVDPLGSTVIELVMNIVLCLMHIHPL